MQDARSPCDVHDAPCRRRRLVRRWRPFPGGTRAAGCRFGMTISSLLTPELVLPALPAQAKAEVLETLAAHVGLVHPHVDARRLGDARCRTRLLEAPSAVELVAVLREHEERAQRSVRAA